MKQGDETIFDRFRMSLRSAKDRGEDRRGFSAVECLESFDALMGAEADSDHDAIKMWALFISQRAMSQAYRLQRIYDVACGMTPIEAAMFFALVMVATESSTHVALGQDGGGAWGQLDVGDGPDYVRIQPQHKLGAYTVDFLVTAGHHRWNPVDREDLMATSQVVVECDGHDFHERTKEQAKHDRKRDRVLQKVGLTVFRYTGSEIWGDVFTCAEEAVSRAQQLASAAAKVGH